MWIHIKLWWCWRWPPAEHSEYCWSRAFSLSRRWDLNRKCRTTQERFSFQTLPSTVWDTLVRPEKKTRSVVVTWPSRERTKPGRNCLLTLSSFLFSEFILWVSPLSQWSTWSRAPSLRGWEQPALLQNSLVWPSQVAFPTPLPFSWMSSRRFWQEVCNSVQPKRWNRSQRYAN